MKDIIYKG